METIKYHELSFLGKRSENQDTTVAITNGDETYLFGVADGMGGNIGGKVASSAVTEKLKNDFYNLNGDEFSENELKRILASLYFSAQSELRNIITENPDLEGMGTTLTSVLIHKNRYVWGNIGDSRLYLLRNGFLERLTVDHTLVEEFAEESDFEIDEQIIDNFGHYLTKSMTGKSEIPDIFPNEMNYSELQDGDIFILCSDGVPFKNRENEKYIITDSILEYSGLKEATESIINKSFYSESADNISVVIIEYGRAGRLNIKRSKPSYPPKEKVQSKPTRLILIKILVILSLIFFLALFYFFF